MNIEQEKEIVASLSSLYPMQKFEEDAIDVVLGAIPHWIPCKEKTPPNIKKTYWVCTDNGIQCECRWTNNIYGFGESDWWGWSFLDTPRYTEIVAWRELPETYKEKEDDYEQLD